MAQNENSKELAPDFIADYDIFLPMDEWERQYGPVGEYLRKNPGPSGDKVGSSDGQ